MDFAAHNMQEFMTSIDTIEITRKLDNEHLQMAICNTFLSHGSRLLLLTTENDDKAWLYFEKDKLTAVFTESKESFDALEDLITWSGVYVKEYRNFAVEERHFSLGLSNFLLLSQESDKQGAAINIIKTFEFLSGFRIYDKDEVFFDELNDEQDYPFEELLVYLDLADDLSTNEVNYELDSTATFLLIPYDDYKFIFLYSEKYSSDDMTKKKQQLLEVIREFRK